ncbi:hypothetical protein IF2G_03550 [Cordyceps javanica]|nr:hypothetical protein IF2G_03550 [Cordyceps javanica]
MRNFIPLPECQWDGLQKTRTRLLLFFVACCLLVSLARALRVVCVSWGSRGSSPPA